MKEAKHKRPHTITVIYMKFKNKQSQPSHRRLWLHLAGAADRKGAQESLLVYGQGYLELNGGNRDVCTSKLTEITIDPGTVYMLCHNFKKNLNATSQIKKHIGNMSISHVRSHFQPLVASVNANTEPLLSSIIHSSTTHFLIISQLLCAMLGAQNT